MLSKRIISPKDNHFIFHISENNYFVFRISAPLKDVKYMLFTESYFHKNG